MDKEEAQDLSWTDFVMLVAPKVLLDYLRPMITIQPNPIPTYTCEDDLSTEDLI